MEARLVWWVWGSTESGACGVFPRPIGALARSTSTPSPLSLSPPGAADAHADDLAALATSSLASGLLSIDRAAGRAADAAVAAALAATAGPAARALTAGLLRTGPKGLATASRPDALRASKWAGGALAALPAADAERAAPKVAAFQAMCLGRGGAGRAGGAGLARAVRAHPSLVAGPYAAAARESPALAAALADACAGVAGPPPDWAPALASLLEAALGDRSPPGASARVRALAPAIASLPAADLLAGPLPAGVRCAKRSAEAGLTGLAVLVEASRKGADLSAGLASVVEAALPSVRGAGAGPSPGPAAAARRALTAMAARVTDVATLGAGVDAILAAAGAGGPPTGRPRNAAERAGLADAVRALAPPGPTDSSLAVRVTDALASLAEGEANEDARRAVLGAAGGWAAKAGGVLPPGFAARVASLISASGATSAPARRDALRSLAAACAANPALGSDPAFGSTLAPPLLKLASEGAAKPAARGDGVAAALAAAAARRAGCSAAAPLFDDALLASPDCGLLAPLSLARLPAEDAALGAALCGELVRGVAGGRVAATQAARGLAALQLSAVAAVRRAANGAASTAVAASPDAASTDMVAALLAWAGAAHAALPPGAAESEGAAAAPPSATELADRLQAALGSALPRGAGVAPLPAPVAADALLLAHHPALTGPRRQAGAPWAALVRAGAGAGVAAGVEADPAGVVARLLAAATADAGDEEEADATSSSLMRTAACSALGAAVAAAAAAVWPALLPALAAAADRTSVDALSADEVKIFLTPPGELALEADATVGGAGGGGAGVRAIGKGLGELRLEGAGSTGAPPPRAATSKPPSRSSSSKAVNGTGRSAVGSTGASKKDAAALWLEAALEAEAKVRAVVAASAAALERGLAAVAGSLSTPAARASAGTSPLLGELAGLVTPLLASPVVGGQAAATAAALAACLPTPARVGPSDLASALASAARGRNPATSPAASAAIRALGAASRRGVDLSPAAGELVAPALAAVLTAPPPPKAATSRSTAAALASLQADAMDGLQAHAARATGTAAGDLARVLYAALDAVPAYGGVIGGLLGGLAARSVGGGLAGLASGLAARLPRVRAAALAALPGSPDLVPGCVDALPPALGAALFAATRDPDAGVAAAAAALWASLAPPAPPPASLADPLIALLSSPAADVRTAASAALGALLVAHAESPADSPRAPTLAALLALGAAVDASPPPARAAAAAALQSAAPAWSLDDAITVVQWLLAGPLADEDEAVRAAMVRAGVAVVGAAGGAGESSDAAARLLPAVEAGLEAATATCGGDEDQADALRCGAAALLGAAASHLPPGDPRVGTVLATLLDVLRTPSASVQAMAADALPGLMPALGGPGPQKALLDKLIAAAIAPGASYGDRKGAAYGLAGAVKGLGLSAVNGMGVLDAVKGAIGDATDPGAREGGLLLFEALVDRLGRLFEPYVVQCMPALLDRFGDSAAPVRTACEGAARAVMAALSSQGVKLTLPTLVAGAAPATGTHWRSQAGSVTMLGAMAHCAPRQLATALPSVVPALSAALADPHPRVAEAAKAALAEVGGVVRNPEVRGLAPALLAAIADPGAAARPALDALLRTSFVNTIDAASLALVVPVLHRGLRDRGGDAKKRAARIVGAMASLIEGPKDMAPYVPLLLPEVRAALVDPHPEVRGTAAKALGAMLRGMGGAAFGDDLLPWLLTTLAAEGAAVERSGAAQGLAEVLAVLGPAHADALLPTILAGCSAKAPPAREGSLALFRFLPSAMPAAFKPHLAAVLPAVLGGLADDNDGVREAALLAARTAVDLYARDSLDLLLPAVEAGAAAASWRIRQSSVELLGDLLFKVVGTSGRARADGAGSDDEGASTDDHGRAITAALGADRRAEVLGLLYLCRSDVAGGVRSAALHVWKTVVANTPRTVGEVMPALMAACISALASSSDDRASSAGRCLGELVRKLGERALRQVAPILASGLSDADPATRRGAAEGVRELVGSVPRSALADAAPGLVPALQAALTDGDPGVAAAASAAFGALFKGGAPPSLDADDGGRGGRGRGSGGGGGGGKKGGGGGGKGGGRESAAAGDGGSSSKAAADALLPGMLAALGGPEPGASQALAGLRVVLGARPAALGSMLPGLLVPPLTPSACGALASLAGAAGPAVHGHLGTLVPTLLTAAAAEGPAEEGAEMPAAAALDAVCSAVAEDGAHLLIAHLDAGLGDRPTRAAAARALASYAASPGRPDMTEHVPGLLASLIGLLGDEEEDGAPPALPAVLAALKAVAGAVPKEDALSHARTVRDALSGAVERAERRRRKAGGGGGGPPAALLPGLALPGALAPLLPIYLQAVLQGSADLREVAATGLGELVRAADPAVLRPHVVGVAGPLIRVVGDRFPPEVRSAILGALGALLSRAGPGLRPFVPQLQTTFVKGLGDPARGVRVAAASNLGALAALSARADALVAELASGAAAAGVGGASPPPGAPPTAAGGPEPVLMALMGALACAPADKLTPETVAKAVGAAAGALAAAEAAPEAVVLCAAAAFGGAVSRLEDDASFKAALSSGPLGSAWPPVCSAAALAAVARRCPARLAGLGLVPASAAATVALARAEGSPARCAAARAAAYLGAAEVTGKASGALAGGVAAALTALAGPDQSGDVQRAALGGLRFIAARDDGASPSPVLAPYYGDVITALCALLASSSGPTKLAAERTLARVLRADASPDAAVAFLASPAAGALAKTHLTEANVRRFGRLPAEEADEAADFGEP